ncbi:MAG TPA: MYXO-CTERM sorting domain-containing protein [Gemmatimonadales bacterium]|nr:MYXO-CTERM sorting domain-containing protein [Gemmatimonadales bacterium]
MTVRSVGRVAALAAALAVGASGVARADGFKSWTVCGGNAFSTCAAVTIQVTGTHVTMRAWNLSGLNGTYAATVFTGIGLFNVPAGVTLAATPNFTMSGPARTGDSPADWAIQTNKQIGGGVNLNLVALSGGTNGSVNNSIASGCANNAALPGGRNQLYENPCHGDMTNLANWVTFSFDVTQTWDPSQGTYLLVKGQNGPNGMSTECITGGTSQNCSVTPEPVTMTLLATGLAGIGGLGFLRRRRGFDVEST